MSKEKAGLVKAHCPGQGIDGKPKYLTMGVMFRDSDTGKFSIKIDLIPALGSGWSGWCNVFPENSLDWKNPTVAPITKDDVPF